MKKLFSTLLLVLFTSSITFANTASPFSTIIPADGILEFPKNVEKGDMKMSTGYLTYDKVNQPVLKIPKTDRILDILSLAIGGEGSVGTFFLHNQIKKHPSLKNTIEILGVDMRLQHEKGQTEHIPSSLPETHTIHYNTPIFREYPFSVEQAGTYVFKYYPVDWKNSQITFTPSIVGEKQPLFVLPDPILNEKIDSILLQGYTNNDRIQSKILNKTTIIPLHTKNNPNITTNIADTLKKSSEHRPVSLLVPYYELHVEVRQAGQYILHINTTRYVQK